MEFLGIGPLELFFIVLIALIILGPKDMVKTGRMLGKLMRRTVLSPTWLDIQRKVRNLPYEMMREAGLDEEEMRREVKNIKQEMSVTMNQDFSLQKPAYKIERQVPGNGSPTQADANRPPVEIHLAEDNATELPEPPVIPTPQEPPAVVSAPPPTPAEPSSMADESAEIEKESSSNAPLSDQPTSE